MGGSGFLNINGGEFLLLLLIVLIVVGPERLPEVAKQGAIWLKKAVRYVRDAKDALTDEFGDEMADLKDFDPRQYDPRKIVRDAWNETAEPTPKKKDPAAPTPYDDEAT